MSPWTILRIIKVESEAKHLGGQLARPGHLCSLRRAPFGIAGLAIDSPGLRLAPSVGKSSNLGEELRTGCLAVLPFHRRASPAFLSRLKSRRRAPCAGGEGGVVYCSRRRLSCSIPARRSGEISSGGSTLEQQRAGLVWRGLQQGKEEDPRGTVALPNPHLRWFQVRRSPARVQRQS